MVFLFQEICGSYFDNSIIESHRSVEIQNHLTIRKGLKMRRPNHQNFHFGSPVVSFSILPLKGILLGNHFVYRSVPEKLLSNLGGTPGHAGGSWNSSRPLARSAKPY